MALGCVALVLGYEGHELRKRFGPPPARLIPPAGALAPTRMERLSCYLFVLVPWLILYEAVLAIGMPPDAISGVSAPELRLPVLEWWQIVYASTYFLTVLAPVFAKTRSDLRSYSLRGLGTMLVAYPLYLAIPLISPKRPFTPHSIPGRLLFWERTLDSPVAAFPSFHVIWSILAAEVFARRWPKFRGLFYGWAILVAISCVATSQHSLLDVLGGAATVALVARAPQLWRAVRRHAAGIANSRRNWRIIGAGMGAFVAFWLAGTLAGPKALPAVFVAASAALAGTVFLRGSTCGLMSGTLAGVAGALAAPLFGADPWLVLAALSMSGLCIEATGNLQRLADGRYESPPYSIICHGLAALALTRLWMLSAPLHLIAGTYFILAGLGRFVRDVSRGANRAARCSAVASVICGALMTAIGHSESCPHPAVRMENRGISCNVWPRGHYYSDNPQAGSNSTNYVSRHRWY